MNKTCPICDCPFKDGESVVATMIAKFKHIPSDVNFAIEHPTRCIEIVHEECFDEDEIEEEYA